MTNPSNSIIQVYYNKMKNTSFKVIKFNEDN